MSKSVKVLFISAIFALGFGVAACGGDDGNGNGGGGGTGCQAACQNYVDLCSGDAGSSGFSSVSQCTTACEASGQGIFANTSCVANASTCLETAACAPEPDAGNGGDAN